MFITSRQKKILNAILQSSDYVTVSEIAASLSVSTRTVLRELNELDRHLAALGAVLEKKPGYGIHFIGTEEDKKSILKKISEEKEDVVYTKEERRLYILTELLKNKSPVKTFVFTKQLGVTEATISSDLDRCEKWLEENKIKLVRKPGVGVYPKGDERDFRRAMINLFYENFDYSQLSEYESNESFAQKTAASNIFNIFDREMLLQVKSYLDTLEDKPKLLGTDRTYIGLIMHLCLMVTRIQSADTITLKKKVLEELASCEEFKLASTISQGLEQIFHIHISKDETGYLAMLLRGVQGVCQNPKTEADTQAEQIADEIVSIAEAKTGYILSNNTTFYNGLLAHIVPTINRLKMNLDIRNPLLEDIKVYYSHLFSLARLCSKAIESTLNIPVPESEIGYIAMHLGVALENKGIKRRRIYKAIICCPSGMVSARLLSIRVEREFPNIQIVDIVSTTNIERDIFENQEIELAVSTIPLPDMKLPCATVSPFLLDSDKEKIEQLLKQLEQTFPSGKQSPKTKQDIKESLSGFKEYIDGVLQVLNSFFFVDHAAVTDVTSLIAMVAQQITKIESQRQEIIDALTKREQYGSTIAEQSSCMLLHCKTSGVTQLHFGIIRPQSNMNITQYDSSIDVKVVLVMLAPQNCPQRHIEVLGSISQGLLHYEWFTQALLTGDESECYAAIEKLMSQFYEEKRFNT